MPLNARQLSAVMNMPLEGAALWLPHIGDALVASRVKTDAQLANWLTQVKHETGGLRRVTENLNYSAHRLLQVFRPSRIIGERPAKGDADKARQLKMAEATAKEIAGNPEMIANAIYGGHFGKTQLGNAAHGDGWKYRGRGCIQVTGRANYVECAKALVLPLVDKPEILEQRGHAAMSAAWFWMKHDLAQYNGVVSIVRQIINGGTNGIDECERDYPKILEIVKGAYG